VETNVFIAHGSNVQVRNPRRKVMGVECLKEPSGLYVLCISGTLTDQDQQGVENFGRTTIDPSGKVNVLRKPKR
jgi:hypothetical protein